MKVSEFSLTPEDIPSLSDNMKTLQVILELRCLCGQPSTCGFNIRKIHASRGQDFHGTKMVLHFNDGRSAEEVTDVGIVAREMCPNQPSHLYIILRNDSEYYEGCGDFSSRLFASLEA